jgi:3-hydroxyacyl-[acyl-carrier-protein] dehydratase
MADISVQDLLALLPHRYPMLLVDKVLSCDDKTRITAVKNVSFNEPFFSGHFPGQTGGLLMMRLRPGPAGRLPVFMGIDKARFRRMVVPGDQLRMEIELLTLRGPVARFAGKAYVGDALASEAELTCMLTEQEKQA